MMNKKNNIITACGLVMLFFASCTKDPNSPGYEYMPDMYRSPSVEAYVDYENPDMLSAMLPPAGTIPFSEDPSKAIFNFPFSIAESPKGYIKAAEIKNPIPYSVEVREEGRVLYEKFCTHCHGEKGDGQGQIVLNGKFDGVPSYSAGAVATLPEGQMFYSITYGKNMMGAHASQLNKEERWKVVHYVKYLQAGGKDPGSDSTKVAANDTIQ